MSFPVLRLCPWQLCWQVSGSSIRQEHRVCLALGEGHLMWPSLSLLLLGASLIQVHGFLPPTPALRRPTVLPAASLRATTASLLKRSSTEVVALRKQTSRLLLRSTSEEAGDDEAAAPLTGAGVDGQVTASGAVVASEEVPPVGPWYKDPVGAVKRWYGGAKMDRAQLAALGASALCSYGLISNINYCGSMIAAFVIFVKRNNVSPFGSGMWKEFLTIYGGLWAAMNFLRPVRFWLSVGLTPYFDKVVETIAAKTGVKRPVAFGLTVFLVNVCGTLTFLSTGLLLASYFTKVPLIAKKL